VLINTTTTTRKFTALRTSKTALQKHTGFMIEVLDEVARRAGFTWRNSYTFFEAPETYGKSWTDLLLWQISSYDLSGEWWVPTLRRRALGVSFLEGFYDSSIALVTQVCPTSRVCSPSHTNLHTLHARHGACTLRSRRSKRNQRHRLAEIWEGGRRHWTEGRGASFFSSPSASVSSTPSSSTTNRSKP
jgi:hypothetical protein